MPEPATITIPCFNEADRLQLGEFERFLKASEHKLLFVDDGSTDATRQILARFCETSSRSEVISLPANRGKAEAVRTGLRRSIAQGVELVGYADADLATPVDEILRLINTLSSTSVGVVVGSRIAFLGTEIERSAARHYLGRVFATAASLSLGMRIYDTQCGAKFFQTSPELADALREPFGSRWVFDVELLGRLRDSGVSIIEVPLRRWVDVSGSRLGVRGRLRAGFDLLQLARAMRRSRRQVSPGKTPGRPH